jgi:excinuclease UvrABC ATPase subunit
MISDSPLQTPGRVVRIAGLSGSGNSTLATEVDLAPENVSLAECLNSRKESGNDEDGKSAIHARIQARSGAASRGWPERCEAVRTLGVFEQTLYNWVKAQRKGKLKGLTARATSTPSGWRSVGFEPNWRA